jgi:nitrogen fixation protein FixH
MTTAPLTGRKVFAITASFFAVIIGVNFTLAYQAVGTFPGLEVDNSYVASQTFDAERAAQNALGWSLDVTAQGGSITLTFTGADGQPVQPKSLVASVGRATERQDDRIPDFTYSGGRYSTAIHLDPGKWVLRVQALAADGSPFRQRIAFYVKD